MKKIVAVQDLDMWLDGGIGEVAEFSLPRAFQAPISLVWELTGKCFSNCIYCSGGFPQKTIDMTTEEKLKLAKELIDMKIFMISLSGGDPLLCEDLELLVNEFTKAQIPTMICSPGLCIDEEMIKRLCENELVAFNVSIDSVNPLVNDYQRGKEGACKQALELLSLIDKYGKGRIFTSVEMVITQKNINEIIPLIEEMKEHWVNEIRIQPVIAMNEKTYVNGLVLTAEDMERLKETVERAVAETESDPTSESVMCVRFVDQSKAVIKGIRSGTNWGGIISPEGDLMLSGYIPYIYGNIKDYNGFKDAWQKGFSRGWERLQTERELYEIKGPADLQELYKKKGYVKQRYE